MKITLATCGSRGDVQPILALALALKSAGHDVLLAAPPENAGWIQSYQCPFKPLIGNVHVLLESCPNAHTIKPAIFFLRFVRQDLEAQFSVLPEIVVGSDLVLGASLAFGLPSVAESLGIPYRFIALTPQLLPSGQHPFPAIRNQYLPSCLNRLSWGLAKTIDKLNLTALIRKQRHRLGLKPINDAWSHILGRHVVVASDPLIGRVPADVKQDYTQTGYFHLKQNGELSADIERFLAAGPPPFYVGFGSMPSRDQKANLPLILKAALSAGQRVVVSNKLAQGHSLPPSKNCIFVNNVPHTLLFQRLAAVVHHGGAGTTATAAWSGVPQIIVPHILDQYYWASRIRHLGVGPRPIWRSRLTAGRLSAALCECVSNKNMQQRAQKVAAIIQKQDSLGNAVRFIETEPLAEKRKH